jgi:hypothetical protein
MNILDALEYKASNIFRVFLGSFYCKNNEKMKQQKCSKINSKLA